MFGCFGFGCFGFLGLPPPLGGLRTGLGKYSVDSISMSPNSSAKLLPAEVSGPVPGKSKYLSLGGRDVARASATCSRLDFVVVALVLDLVVALVLDLVVALVVVLGSGDETPLPEIGGKSNFGITISVFWGAENFAPLGSGTLPVGISMP